MRHRLHAAVAIALLATVAAPTAVPAAELEEEPHASDNMEFLGNVAFDEPQRYPEADRKATDMDFATLEVSTQPGKAQGHGAERFREEREFAFVGTYLNGLQVVDITEPTDPEVVAVYDCAVAQSDVFVFERPDLGRTLLAYSSDRIARQTDFGSDCHTDNGVGEGEYGTFIVDVTDPYDPQSVSFVEYPRGTHQVTIDPTGHWIYSSPSALIQAGTGQIDVTDVSDPENPVTQEPLELVTGADSHDITFNAEGTRAYSAALTHTLVIDTTDPGEPEVIGRIVDPGVNIHHQADPVTITDETTGVEHDFLIVTDEIAGAAGNQVCPGGGLHVYDITGHLERAPVKVGAWFAPEAGPVEGAGQGVAGLDRCTAHVLEIHPDEQVMTIAWYALGTRVLDLSGLVGLAAGASEEMGSLGAGMREIGYLHFDDSDVWAVKTPRIDADGSFVAYAADTHRMLDVIAFHGDAPESDDGGRWMSPEQAHVETLSLQSEVGERSLSTSCLLDDGR